MYATPVDWESHQGAVLTKGGPRGPGLSTLAFVEQRNAACEPPPGGAKRRGAHIKGRGCLM